VAEYVNRIRSIAVGSFDGMQVAHRELIALADAVAVIERERDYPTLTPGFKRSWYCDKPMAFYRFETIRHLSAEAFVERLREDYPRLGKIVVGYDFRFGRERQGDPETLERLFDGEVVVVSEVTMGGVSVHSRTIRHLLASGDLAAANRLLGRRYAIDGEPVRGQGLGAKEFVPTLNLSVEEYCLPLEGVYAGYTRLGGECYPSVIFLGHRESVDGSFAIETHLLGREEVEPGPRVFLEFEARLRPNRRFETFDALREEIRRDIARAREVLGL
jgi:riboflavin kinase/FMN adenylyltransferase